MEETLKYFKSDAFKEWLRLALVSPGPNTRQVRIFEYNDIEKELYEKKKEKERFK